MTAIGSRRSPARPTATRRRPARMAPPRWPVAELVAELRVLRKGRGLQLGQRLDRIGPTLRAVCTIADHDRPVETLAKVADWVREAIVDLPQDLQTCVLGAYGLHEDARHRYLVDRVRWIAEQLDRDPRTARRRINAALTCMAEWAAHPPKKMIDLRRFIGQPVKLTVASPGATADGASVQKCYLLAVPRALDDPGRFFAVVETLSSQPGTIAIPTSRILGVAPLNDVNGHRWAWSTRPGSGDTATAARPYALPGA